MKKEFNLQQINRIVYIWARYEGIRDATKEGKHYSKSDIEDLIGRLTRFKNNPDSFNEGFEKEEDEENGKRI